MIDRLETLILSTLQTLYDAWGWLGVSLLLVFENATGVTPSEIILGLAGWMLIAEHELSPVMILVGGLYAALASAVGASIAYWVARLGGRPLVERFARLVRIDPIHIQRVECQFNRWGAGLVLVGRLIPGVRTLVSLPAGLARMPYPAFLGATLVGSYLWCSLLIGAGYLLGHEWHLVSGLLKTALPYLFGGGLLALAVYFALTRRKGRPALLSVECDG